MTYDFDRLRETRVVREGTRKTMQANRSTDSIPEQKLRRALWAAGVRGYRKNVRKLPGKPDIVFGPAKLVIFVHGCYWHRCPACSRNLNPKTNAKAWQSKFQRNIERDAENQEALESMGYRVLTIWECEVKSDPAPLVAQIRRELAQADP